MLNLKDYILLLLGIVSSIIANIIWDFSVHWIYLSVILILTILIYILNSKVSLMKYIGIKRIEKNIASGTNTEELLNLANDNFFISGRGASRFIEANNFQQTLSRMARRTPIRFLILAPGSPAPKVLSKERNVDDNHISEIISASIRTIDTFKNQGHNIDVRFYENPNYIPIFRIVCVDNKELFISYYQRQETGKNSFQIVLEDSKNSNNLYIAFKEHFESLWDIAENK